MKRLYLFLLFFCYGFLLADDPPCPGCGAGGDGFGAPASPIDMYVYILGIIAILLIVHFAKKYRAQKSLN